MAVGRDRGPRARGGGGGRAARGTRAGTRTPSPTQPVPLAALHGGWGGQMLLLCACSSAGTPVEVCATTAEGVRGLVGPLGGGGGLRPN